MYTVKMTKKQIDALVKAYMKSNIEAADKLEFGFVLMDIQQQALEQQDKKREIYNED